MDSTDPEQWWFVIQAKPRQEAVAALELQAQGFEVYLPLLARKHHLPRRNGRPMKNARRVKYEWQTEALYPGYLFIDLSVKADGKKINETRGVARLIPWPGGSKLTKLIADLRANEAVDLRAIKDERPPGKVWKKGDKARLVTGEHGNLAHLEMVVEAARAGRIRLLFEFLGRETPIEVDEASIRPA